jgi:NAD(P) transhydrogenase subunit alpha
MVKNMRPGSVVLDMAVEFGGNCEISEKEKVVKKHGVTIIGESNLPSLVATNASEVYAKNLLALIEHISSEGKIELDFEDEIVKGSVICYKKEVVHERTKALLQ